MELGEFPPLPVQITLEVLSEHPVLAEFLSHPPFRVQEDGYGMEFSQPKSLKQLIAACRAWRNDHGAVDLASLDVFISVLEILAKFPKIKCQDAHARSAIAASK